MEAVAIVRRHNISTLIPVLVTGIQPPRVRAVNESFDGKEFLASKNLDALDSCDEHRNEGARGEAILPIVGSAKPERLAASVTAAESLARTPPQSPSSSALSRGSMPYAGGVGGRQFTQAGFSWRTREAAT
ncbi:hypothetical protein ELH82_04395 [Rhizobium leguminosarum]|nr:hypothetical protein ELH82_04395 [Rhizobium leguminosarum]